MGEPLHRGNPTLSAMDAGFQWYGKASQLENILGSVCVCDLKIGTPVGTLPDAWRYRVSAGTGRPGVSIL